MYEWNDHGNKIILKKKPSYFSNIIPITSFVTKFIYNLHAQTPHARSQSTHKYIIYQMKFVRIPMKRRPAILFSSDSGSFLCCCYIVVLLFFPFFLYILKHRTIVVIVLHLPCLLTYRPYERNNDKYSFRYV